MSQESDISVLTTHQKAEIRKAIIETARKLIGIKYEFGAEWNEYSRLPESIDCSELVEGAYKINGLRMPDGSQNQYDACVDTASPTEADLAFFGRGANPKQIYHVGLLFGGFVIEARAFQPDSKFETGKVIMRPLESWKNYKNFVGIRAWPKLV